MSKMVTFREMMDYSRKRGDAVRAKTARRKALARKPKPENPYFQHREARKEKEAWLKGIRVRLEDAKAARAKLSPAEREELDKRLLSVASKNNLYDDPEDLIRQGANPFATNEHGSTVAEMAFVCAQRSVGLVLQRYGATRNGPVIEFKMD